jgi:hypothetical protein
VPAEATAAVQYVEGLQLHTRACELCSITCGRIRDDFHIGWVRHRAHLHIHSALVALVARERTARRSHTTVTIDDDDRNDDNKETHSKAHCESQDTGAG